jgi:hypothetical protein
MRIHWVGRVGNKLIGTADAARDFGSMKDRPYLSAVAAISVRDYGDDDLIQ